MIGLLEPEQRPQQRLRQRGRAEILGLRDLHPHAPVSDRQRLSTPRSSTVTDRSRQGTSWSAPQSTGDERGSPSKSWSGNEAGAPFGHSNFAVKWWVELRLVVVVSELSREQNAFNPRMIEALSVLAFVESQLAALPTFPTTVLKRN
jgi:hypothetical protein